MDVVAYLNQTEVWFHAETGRMVQIREMEFDHRMRAARWLMDKAPGLILICETQINEDIVSGTEGANLADVLSLLAQSPRAWMRRRPLFQTLIRGLPREDVSRL